MVVENTFQGFKLEDLRGYKEKAHIGYMSMKMYEPRPEATWGRYNDRVISKPWVATLVRHFGTNMDNCTTDDAIDMAVDLSWIQNIKAVLKTVNGKTIAKVPEIEFTSEGLKAIKPDNLIMLGGNHRRLAVKDFVDELKSQLEREKASLKAKEGELSKTDEFAGELTNEVQVLKQKVDVLEGRIKTSQHWVVRLFDKGESLLIGDVRLLRIGDRRQN